MKLPSFLVVAAGFASSALAQTINIGYPTSGTTLHRGKSVTVEIQRPNSIMGCTEVGIALAVIGCSSASSCPSPSQQLGSVLYSGPFTPTGHGQAGYYQNFTVTIPDYLNPGPGLFSLTHLCLIGAGPFPLLEFRNASVTLA
ncbi:hypothetical protein CONPUDRAFT_111470 [Coniophora puteana RWD-64-598 SS2]|uniref:Phosphatidylglycerol/phosphatidylinositol transfer protein n=1 Tax=Coniophora puteana (strain RWD-64-598) TaxID=741705 RepID=A0A5M3MCC1_CONPW|nr:uncharacterized protein CONPUDRAFT_111470 [Coniophora puteana RWD-64-598 SS2]EIW76490.1 hypothetical protein CONPUDRAFT_111470 [Coniophora puteana RWD-64-598 SS2]